MNISSVPSNYYSKPAFSANKPLANAQHRAQPAPVSLKFSGEGNDIPGYMKGILALLSLSMTYGLIQLTDQNNAHATHTEQSITGLPTSTVTNEPPPPPAKPKLPTGRDSLTLRELKDGTIPVGTTFSFDNNLTEQDLGGYFSDDLDLGPTNVVIETGDLIIKSGTPLKLVLREGTYWFNKEYDLVIADRNDQSATVETVNSDKALPAATATSATAAADYKAHLHELAANPDYDDTAASFGPAILETIEAGGGTFELTPTMLKGVQEDAGVSYLSPSRQKQFKIGNVDLIPSTGGTIEAGDSITVKIKQN